MAAWPIIKTAWEILQILTKLVNHTTDNYVSLIARGGGGERGLKEGNKYKQTSTRIEHILYITSQTQLWHCTFLFLQHLLGATETSLEEEWDTKKRLTIDDRAAS